MAQATSLPEPRAGLLGHWDRFIGPGATRGETLLTLGAAFGAAIALVLYAFAADLGWTGWQIALAGIAPLSFGRFLLFTFYRWETCVREATVLGMLGMGSLGFWIQDARARNHYDAMFFFILAGAALVLIGDLVSLLSRRFVRRA